MRYVAKNIQMNRLFKLVKKAKRTRMNIRHTM